MGGLVKTSRRPAMAHRPPPERMQDERRCPLCMIRVPERESVESHLTLRHKRSKAEAEALMTEFYTPKANEVA